MVDGKIVCLKCWATTPPEPDVVDEARAVEELASAERGRLGW
jgi:hypothetical protein